MERLDSGQFGASIFEAFYRLLVMQTQGDVRSFVTRISETRFSKDPNSKKIWQRKIPSSETTKKEMIEDILRTVDLEWIK